MTVSSKKLEPVFMLIKASVLIPIERYLGTREGVSITELKIQNKLCLAKTVG